MSTIFYSAHTFDVAAARIELAAFKALLSGNTSLGERKHILASFDQWPNLCSLFGTYHPRIHKADLVKREFKVGGHFVADLAVRRSNTDCVCLVEFEPAKDHDIFAGNKPRGRKIAPWASGMEKGFSQIVDWAWALDVNRDQPDFQDAFGSKRPNVMTVLVVGRSASLTDKTRMDRWEWRSRHISYSGIAGVQLQTYDDLYEYFDIQLKL